MQQKTLIKFKNKEIFRKDLFDYKVFEITPSRFIETSPKALEEILNTMTALYEEKLRYDYLTKSFVYIQQNPIYYEILYEGKNIHFNYIIPDKYSKILTNKIDKIYRTATIIEKKDYFNKFKNKYYCSFVQKKHFMFSLNSDYREHGLLDGIMSVLNNLQSDDSLLLQIGIIPLNENWKEQWKLANVKHKNGEDLTIHTNPINFIMESLFKTSEGILNIFDHVVGIEKETKQHQKVQTQMDRMGSYKNSHMTTSKILFNGFLIQIKMYCDNETRVRYYSKIFDGVFKILDADQMLEIGKIKLHKSDNREFDLQFTKNIWSCKEVTHFLRLPDRRMQLDYKENLKNVIEVTENVIPSQLLNGEIPIGEATYKGQKIMTYWNTKDKNIAPMHKIITGLQRTGKSSYITNFAIESIKAGQSIFVIDTIKTCSVANDIRDHLPVEYQNKIVVLDYSNLDYLLSLSWNELRKYQNNDSPKYRMMLSSMLAGSLESFIESVGGLATSQEKFSTRMKRFLSASAKLVLSQEDTNIKNVLEVLQYKDVRDKFIKSSGLPLDNIIIQELRQLDDPKTGTKYDLISGIIDRASIMTNDYLMEILLNVPPNDDIDFRYFADNGYCVLIKMSELKISRTSLRPLTSFIFSKIWLSMFSRGEQENPRMTSILLDEIHNFPEVCNMIKGNCREAAKYALSYVFTSHMLTDLKGLLPIIKGSGVSFMLFKTVKENLRMLEEELMEGNVTIQEALQLKPYNTINIINYDRDYTVYTSKVPDLISKRYKKYDRSYIDDYCSKKYGVKWEE